MALFNPFIPLVLNLKGLDVLVIGGGTVAVRKLQAVCGRGAKVTLVAPKVAAEAKALLKGKQGKVLVRKFRKSDLKKRDLVFIMTDDAALNRKIAALCKKKKLWFNCATGAEQGFLMTSFFERGDLLLAVSTRGAVPFLAKAIKRSLEELFDNEWVRRIQKLKELRADLIASKRVEELKKLAHLTLEQIRRVVDAGEAYLSS